MKPTSRPRCCCVTHRDYRDIFEAMDTNRSGEISKKEMQKALDKLGFDDLSSKEVGKLVEFFDKDGDGKVDYREFVRFCKRKPASLDSDSDDDVSSKKKKTKKKKRSKRDSDSDGSDSDTSDDEDFTDDIASKLYRIFAELLDGGKDYEDVFEMLDEDGSGRVGKREFQRALSKLGFDLSKAETKLVLKKFDKDGNGKIEYKEFIKFCKKGASKERRSKRKTKTMGDLRDDRDRHALDSDDEDDQAGGGIF